MHPDTGPDGYLAILSTLFNMTIVAGYLAVPLTVLRLIPMKRNVRMAGVMFFLTCAVTHIYMAIGPPAGHHSDATPDAVIMLINHFVQAVAVWAFVLGLATAVRDALARQRERLAAGGKPRGGR